MPPLPFDIPSYRLMTDKCINSIDRAVLNEELLDRAAASKDTRLFFRHKVQSIDFDQKTMIVRDLTRGTDSDVPFDLCIGADGSYSLVRRQMMRVVRSVGPLLDSISAFY